jgi:alginate O-acetyltransferase complex protein AlgI
MLFTEFRFIAFFALAFGVHWALRRNGWRKSWLLVCSYVFYAAWDWRFLGLILASTLIDFVAGGMLGRAAPPGGKRPWLVLSLVGNLGMLGVFKYYDFFVESGAALLGALGLDVSPARLGLVIPVGISFYTFQTLSYTIDVYRGNLTATRNLRDFALFVAFFPQLVAGPIVRAAEFLPQLDTLRRFWSIRWRQALLLFLFGYVKKACIADNFAPVVDAVFAEPELYGAGGKWLALLLYTVQIYCDFAGYSDMAIATAACFGYALPLNFNFPYLSRSITEHWRRWHISLASWFRDYVYFAIGGSRGGPARSYANLVFTFFLCGLWHGAGWHYIAWAMVHGVLLVVERIVGLRGRHVLGLPYALTMIVLSLVFIRSPDIPFSLAYYAALFGAGPAGSTSITPIWWGVLGAFAVVHVLMSRKWLERGADKVSPLVFAMLYGAAWAVALPCVAVNYKPFIYFQF